MCIFIYTHTYSVCVCVCFSLPSSVDAAFLVGREDHRGDQGRTSPEKSPWIYGGITIGMI